MAAMPAGPVAVGMLASGAWVGFVADGTGFHLAFARPDGGTTVSESLDASRRNELLAATIAYFEEALDPPPPELEATQADLAGLLAWMAKTETDAARRGLVREALDAIDDGLAGDAVVARLGEARRGLAWADTKERADAVDLLVARFRELGGESAADPAAPSV
jgi:hypothetical protein